MSSETIDFVITWVDGNDPEWLEEKQKYSGKTPSDNRDRRYREWDLLRYWFRSVEKFAPWVRKIHFVTWGHTPDWLNTNHPQINIVKHEDFIPNEYLPTFSSRAIDFNLHRIPGLSDKFVYFNDDMFLLKPVQKSDFFKKGMPKDTAIMNVLSFSGNDDKQLDFDKTFMAPIYNTTVINRHYSKKDVIPKNIFKWFNFKYGKDNFRNLLSIPWSNFPGFMNYHLPYSYKKESFIKAWELEKEVLIKTCSNRFRKSNDINNWLISYLQIVEGDFRPRNPDFGKMLAISSNKQKNEYIHKAISNQQYKVLCINDTVNTNEDEVLIISQKLQNSFQSILPNKSNFEV